jgi:hypothetical protein
VAGRGNPPLATPARPGALPPAPRGRRAPNAPSAQGELPPAAPRAPGPGVGEPPPGGPTAPGVQEPAGTRTPPVRAMPRGASEAFDPGRRARRRDPRRAGRPTEGGGSGPGRPRRHPRVEGRTGGDDRRQALVRYRRRSARPRDRGRPNGPFGPSSRRCRSWNATGPRPP